MGSARPFFSTSQKLVWRWPGLALGVVLISCSVPSWLFSLAPVLWAVEKPDPWQSCRLLEPLSAHGAQRAPGQKRRPIAHPLKVNSSQKRAHQKRQGTIQHDRKQERSETFKNDHPKSEPTTGPSTTIRESAFLLHLAQSQGHRQPPNCSPEADHSHGCRSMCFLSCSFEHGREDCTLRAQLTKHFFPTRVKHIFCHDRFFAHRRRSMGLSRDGKTIKKLVLPKRSKTMFLKFGVL